MPMGWQAKYVEGMGWHERETTQIHAGRRELGPVSPRKSFQISYEWPQHLKESQRMIITNRQHHHRSILSINHDHKSTLSAILQVRKDIYSIFIPIFAMLLNLYETIFSANTGVNHSRASATLRESLEM
jgi:hypothetical protein